MRILGHIHTWNDEEVIEESLVALLHQTYPLEEILLVDNGSTDRTLRRAFPGKVKVIRHGENRGTCGAVETGFAYGLAKQYDWIWVFDADSAPHQDALEQLLVMYGSFPPELQAQTWLLASLPIDAATGEPRHGILLTAQGPEQVRPLPEQRFYECDVAIWTGSLYKLAAVRSVGPPLADYFLDCGEYEYGYRGKRCGYKAFMHQGSLLRHDLGAGPVLHCHRLGPLSFKMFDMPAMRCYYRFRNSLYFWMYQYDGHKFSHLVGQSSWWTRHLIKLILLARWTEFCACVRGLWDGLRKNMHHRY